MKKTLALALALLLLPLSALAATLSVDLETATLEELQAAQATLTTRISELQAASAVKSEDSVHYEGKGLTMLDIAEFPFFPCKMVLAVDAPGDAKIDITGGTFDWSEDFTATKKDLSRVFSYDCNNYGGTDLSLLVTTDANWTLDIYPLDQTGTPAFSGVGNDVSNMFVLEKPIAVTVSYDLGKGKSDYLRIELVSTSEYGYLRETVFSDSIDGKGKKGSKDVFIKPEDSEYNNCFYIVECKTGTSWSISPK